MEFDFDRLQNILGKGKNAGYQHCLLFPHCLPKGSTFRVNSSPGMCSTGLPHFKTNPSFLFLIHFMFFNELLTTFALAPRVNPDKMVLGIPSDLGHVFQLCQNIVTKKEL